MNSCKIWGAEQGQGPSAHGEERFFTTQADAFAERKRKKKSPCFVQNDGGEAWALWQSDDDFSAGVMFGQVADRFGGLVQAVTPVDDWGYFSGCH